MESQFCLPSLSWERHISFQGQLFIWNHLSYVTGWILGNYVVLCTIPNLFFFLLPLTADKNWYRAVVLEVGENEMNVVNADYGNTERVPYSSILPIPKHLLQLPFRITRCTLSGKKKW